MLPIIYYFYHKNGNKTFSTAKGFEQDRKIIKKWLSTVLIKQIFGSSTDSILMQFRKEFTDDIINKPLKDEIKAFPESFSHIKSLSADDEFIEDLLWTHKDNQYSLAILSLLYPDFNFNAENFHKDHLHPKSKYDELSEQDKEKYGDKGYNSIYNLQLLAASDNGSKNDMSLEEWVEKNTNENSSREEILKRHLIPDVNLSLSNFEQFFEERKKLLIKTLKERLN